MTQRSPGLLRLWNGAELAVEPASGRWDDGLWQWEMPTATNRAGWHMDSDDCGQGVTVIGGHSAWGREGALMALNGIGQGDEVLCVDADGRPHRFAPVDYLLGDGDDPRSWYPDWPGAESRLHGTESPLQPATRLRQSSVESSVESGAALILYTCRPDFGEQVIVRFQEVGYDG
jgi:hypothetical protein